MVHMSNDFLKENAGEHRVGFRKLGNWLIWGERVSAKKRKGSFDSAELPGNLNDISAAEATLALLRSGQLELGLSCKVSEGQLGAATSGYRDTECFPLKKEGGNESI